MFRNPLYLNVQLLQSLADYHGVELPGAREVTHRRRGESRGRAGWNKYVEIGREGETEAEVTETYSTEFRPVRALNDVLDELLEDGALIDLTADDTLAVSQRSIVQAEGVLDLSPVTELAALLSALLPMMFEQLAAGREAPELDPSLIGQVFLEGTPKDVLHVFTMEVGGYLLVMMVDPRHMFANTAMDDLEGELTVLGAVDRIVPAGMTKDLDRYVMPNVNRTTRRMLGGSGLDQLLEGFGDALGRRVDRDALTIHGPAAIVTPAAIY